MKFTRVIAALMTAVIFAAGCRPEDEPNNDGGSGTYNGHDYVDLGLPSGTLWATCNMGANAPEEYGDYYAWGDTTTKAIYDWNSYQYCNGDYDQLIKYCNYSDYGYNGFTDTLTMLQLMDDAATANWGEGWCFPTADQWRELRDNTICIWTTQNDVNGCLFTAMNGAFIFLPAAGGRFDDVLDSAGNQGRYWSSSFNSDVSYYAKGFYLNSYNYDLGDYYRFLGFSVRPVRSASQN